MFQNLTQETTLRLVFVPLLAPLDHDSFSALPGFDDPDRFEEYYSGIL